MVERYEYTYVSVEADALRSIRLETSFTPRYITNGIVKDGWNLEDTLDETCPEQYRDLYMYNSK